MEWLRAAGLSYKEMEGRGVGLVVAEALTRYRKPARFDDELTLRTELSDLGRASLRFYYTLFRKDEEIASGYTHHGCVDLTSGRPCRIPGKFAEALTARDRA